MGYSTRRAKVTGEGNAHVGKMGVPCRGDLKRLHLGYTYSKINRRERVKAHVGRQAGRALPQRSRKTALGVHIYIAKVTGEGKTHTYQVGKMDVILTDSHLDTRIKRCILMNVIVPKLEYICRRSMGRECETRKTVGNSTHHDNNR